MSAKTFIVAALLGTAVWAAPPQEMRVTSDIQQKIDAVSGMAPGNAPMRTGTGVIFGQVTEGDSNRPVPGAIVSINLPGGQAIRVMADGQGRFGFRDMPAGAFSISTSRAGWVDGGYGRTRPSGPTMALALAEGDRVSGVVVPMWRYSSIAGNVADESGDPVVNMPVRVLKRTLTGGKITLKEAGGDQTDDRGAYRITQLEPGEYVVLVPLQQSSSDMPMMMTDAPVAREVTVVRAMAATSAAGGGGNFMMFGGGGDAPSAGVGEDGRPLAFATMFYPNSPVSTRATGVTIASGEERSGIDFALRAVPTSKVSGTAMGPEGAVPNLQLTLVPAEADETATAMETLNGFSDGQGKFTIDGVPPGNYILRATRMPKMAMPGTVMTYTVNGGAAVVRSFSATMPDAPPPPSNDATLWAEMNVGVGNKDLTDLAVSLRPGVKMTGTVQFNGTAEKPAAERVAQMALVLEPADAKQGAQNGTGRVQGDGRFSTVGVPPGRYFIRMKASVPNYSFQSAMINGRDASVVPVEIQGNDLNGVVLTFTDKASELSGQVTGDGQLDAATVIVFPADSTAWTGYGSTSRRLGSARADKQGNFKFQSLPAGDYLVVAMPDKMANDWQNPKFLETLTGEAARVHVSDGSKTTVSLKVSR
jgi:hypothetical protein